MLNPSAIEAFLFDLDGTLLDSDDQAIEALAARAARLGVRNPRRVARRLVMALETPTNAVVTLLDVVGLDEPLFRLSDRLRRWRGLRSVDDFRAVPGALDAVRVLAAHYRLGIVTTRGQRDAEAFLGRFELTPLVEVVVARESTARLKPHPAPIRRAAEALGLPPERCGMVGDTPMDVRAARRAGAWAVGVLCGFGEREELERAGAHLILPSPADLPAAVGLV